MKRRLALFFLAAVCAVCATAVIWQIQRQPTLRQVQKKFRSSDRVVIDRNGQVIDEVRVEKSVRRLSWVQTEDLPPGFVDALLAAEDSRFFWHPGFDPIAFLGAAVDNVTAPRWRGGSTITMQLAQMLGSKKVRPALWRKVRQLGKAVALELAWSKSEILEAYVNLVFYRGELQGLAAASYGLFDKAPSNLTRPEAAVIAALIRSPNAGVDKVRTRACRLLADMGHPEECLFLTAEHLDYIERGYKIAPYMKLAPHVGRRLVSAGVEAESGLLRSTLDRSVQWAALHSLQKQIEALQSQNMNDGAVVVIENATGNVLAYVGNVGAYSAAPQVDAAVAGRQAGSTLKPFIYAKAIDERILTAASVLDDSPLTVSVATGLYKPNNFDRAFRDLVTVRNALASSLNIPAVKALELIGVDNFVQTMTDFGFNGLQRADFYGPSLALGSADVKLLDLTNAYRTLANKGIWSPVRFSPDQASTQAAKRVISEQAAFVVSDILADRQARASSFGLENTLSTKYWSAVKTGTSKDMRDNWCVGFSEKYTVGVWAGNFSGEAMWNVSGIQGAAPVWQEVMNYLHARESSLPPRPPEGLTATPVEFSHSREKRQEWFLAGTEPANHEIEAQPELRSRISYPVEGAIIAIDPDIPEDNHRVLFQIVAPKPDQNVYLNGRRLGRARFLLPWEPVSGRFKLELRDSKGQVVDKVHFEVRGRRFALAN